MLHPLRAGPKGNEGSCWAAHTQAPSKSCQQGRATSGHHSGRQPCTRRNTPLLSKAPLLRLVYLHLAHKMALTEKLCSLFFPLSLPLSVTRLTTGPGLIQRRTATYWSTTSFSHIADFPSSPAPKLPNQLDPAGFVREAEYEAHSWRLLIFSNKSPRFSSTTISPIT